MLKRHTDQLWSRLDSLYANGITRITHGELRHWYGVQRIKKTPWRDIKERWAELLDANEEEYADPQVAEDAGGYSFFFSRNPGTLTELSE